DCKKACSDTFRACSDASDAFRACSDAFRACLKPQCSAIPTAVTLGDHYYVAGAGLTPGMSLHVYLNDKNGQHLAGYAGNYVAGDGTFDVGPFGVPSFMWDNPAPAWAWWTGTD